MLDDVIVSEPSDYNSVIDFLIEKTAKLRKNGISADMIRESIGNLSELAAKAGFNLKLSLEPENSRAAVFSRMAKAMIKDFFCVISVDIKSGRFVTYSNNCRYDKFCETDSEKDFFRFVKYGMSRKVYEEDREKFLYYFDKKHLLGELKKTDTVLFIFRLQVKKSVINVKAKITFADDGYLVVGISDVDAQVKRRIEYEKTREQSLTYSRIAQILAREYFSIYYVDLNSGQFIEYSSKQQYKSLKIEQKGNDFFSTCKENIMRVIYEEDRERMIAAFNKETLMSRLESGRSFSISYRLLLKGSIVYVSLNAMRINDEDGDHILIGVKNVNSQIRREQSYLKALGTAQALAKKDALTNVKNKNAYADAEKALNEKIIKREHLKFAVVVCDINNLKAINDKFGHNAGDDSIKSACSTLCGIFRQSAVFRVGGDEFAVILQGKDYENRAKLFSVLRKTMHENRNKDRVVVACGMAEYRETDASVSAVFERADENMYADKNALKGAGK